MMITDPTANATEAALRARRGVKWSKYGDDVLPAWVADNLVQGLYLAVHAFTEPGEGVIVQTPIYPPFLTSVTALGRRVMDALALDG